MFILINYAYNSRKIYTIDCLAAAVFDCIWDGCYKDLKTYYAEKQQQFAKELQVLQKKIEEESKKLQVVEQKFKEQQEANPDKKKDDKKGAKKGGKGEQIASSPLQQEKIDLEKSLQTSKNSITKYTDKCTKIQQLKSNLQTTKQKIDKEEIYIELVDKTGERKFVKTKLQMQANQFLSDRGIYYLCTVSTVGQDQEVQALVHEGFPVRTVQEDALAPQDQVVFSVKKDDKAKKGGKKK